MTIREAAAKRGIAPGTLRKLCCQGKVKAKKVPVLKEHGGQLKSWGEYRGDSTRQRVKQMRWEVL